MDDSTLIFASLDGLQHLLSIARDFYFLNNITANFSKYELDIYFALRFKKLTSAQLAYLHSAVILPKVYFRSQVTYIPEATLTRTIGSYYGIHKKLLSLSHIFPSLALSSKFFNEDTNLYTYLCQQLISRFMAWVSLYSSGSIYSNWINSSRRSIHHNWIFQTLHILYKSSLTIKLPAALCLDLMSTHFVLLVTLSSELANFEKATWLFSPLWCLMQLIDPFHQFIYTWMDLKRMNLFIHFINIPDLCFHLSAPVMPLQYPSYLLKLQDSALVTIDEHSYIKARNRYYWIAGLGESDSMIFKCVFYTVDVYGTQIVYFLHWIISSSNRCLQLFHISSCIDSTCNNINLFLSPFLLCSFFKILLGYSYVRIPELFLMDSSFPSLSKSTIVSYQLPAISFDIDSKLCLGIEHYIYLHAKCSKSNPISSNEIPCR
ncbi:hypothetical protein RhiirA5_417937 [Rhizophagus irregularis]|uniref:Uncharacterized protein n=1 Tax=Rhizophagus irregularis TaxID=588596 RepID=A0A2N0PLJ1_9GLOM|nr:hypothetical protein RhiirA5_417937 [Rhizophagus irregularis]